MALQRPSTERSAQESLELREGIRNRVEVGAVGREIANANSETMRFNSFHC
jgi:hypothetical protein